jgi:hypothetical protein
MMKKVLSKFYIFQVTVPQLLMWHKHDFSHQLVEVFGPEYEGIIHIIADHMTGQQQTSIQELLQNYYKELFYCFFSLNLSE